MGEYKISEETKQSLIQAAGILCAQHGVDNVSVQKIAKAANMHPSAVNYHFGSKENLLQCVMLEAMRNWNIARLVQYYENNVNLLRSLDGKRQMVRDLLSMFYEMLYHEGQPLWINMVMARCVMGREKLRDMLFKELVEPIFSLFAHLYREITGNEDLDSARCWVINAISSVLLVTINLTWLSNGEPGESVNYSFYRRIQMFTTENALFSMGL